MKKLFLTLSLILSVVSCGSTSTERGANSETKAAVSTADGVEVIYFHTKQRCITCMAIENLTVEVVEQTFSEQLKDGSLRFVIVDISTPEGEKIADKYEVSFSALFTNSWKGGVETKGDLTSVGFKYAKNQPEVFKTELTSKLNELLKK